MRHIDREDRFARSSAIVFGSLAVCFFVAARVDAQTAGGCRTDRAISTIVGAGLGSAAGAIPATIVHRHDQTSSHRIVIGSVSAGALIGFVAAGRDQPCRSSIDSSRVPDAVIGRRSLHARRGALVGGLIGGALGAAGGTLYQLGCASQSCDGKVTRTDVMLFSAAEGAVAIGILGGLIGWAWPTGR